MTKVQDAQSVILEAIKETANEKGAASVMAMKKYVAKRCPNWPMMTFKRAVAKALSKQVIVRVKGKGFSGSVKAAPQNKNKGKSTGNAFSKMPMTVSKTTARGKEMMKKSAGKPEVRDIARLVNLCWVQ